ncbi:MAG TPA: DUF6600 domain-containing protein [Thermoanaerobaculia bacterium]|jgi:hypothetical protein|nr:DUF6600 domain-containing protein [Thermoanaerobaculia bacterium]
MKTTRILFLSLILLGVAAGTGFAATSVSAGIHIGPSGTSVDVGYFYDDLATYGNWVERPSYGWAWRPHTVASSWRPYQAGHWVSTDEGWTWISDEPYGWATYHYGRWYNDPDYGWEWIPGNQWAPAWVAWQEGGDYVGWAPLPPSVDFREGIELNVSLGPDAYVFVPERQFLAPRLNAYFVPRAECTRIFPSTRNITRYNNVNNRVFNQGVPVDRLQRVVGRSVPRYQIADLGADQRHQGARVAQNRVSFFRPKVDKAQVAPPPSRPIAKRAVMTGAAAAAVVAAHHANQAKAPGNAPPPAAARPQTKEERRQIAQAPPSPKGRQPNAGGAREIQPVPQAKRPPAVQQQQAAQQQEARQEKNQQRQAQRQAAQQQGEEQKAQRQAAQQQKNQQQQAQRQAAQQQGQQRQAQKQAAQQRPPKNQEAQQPRQQRQPERQAPPQQGQQRQAQRQPPPQPKNQGKPPEKPRDEKQKPPPQ